VVGRHLTTCCTRTRAIHGFGQMPVVCRLRCRSLASAPTLRRLAPAFGWFAAVASGALVALFLLGCTDRVTEPSAPPSDGGEHQLASAPENVVLQWNSTALEAVRSGALGPPLVARALAIVHTATYDAWAANDHRAVGTRLGGSLRRPVADHTPGNQAGGGELCGLPRSGGSVPGATSTLRRAYAAARVGPRQPEHGSLDAGRHRERGDRRAAPLPSRGWLEPDSRLRRSHRLSADQQLGRAPGSQPLAAATAAERVGRIRRPGVSCPALGRRPSLRARVRVAAPAGSGGQAIRGPMAPGGREAELASFAPSAPATARSRVPDQLPPESG